MILFLWILLSLACETSLHLCTTNTDGNVQANACVMGECAGNNCICEDNWNGESCNECPRRALLQNSYGSIIVNRHQPLNLSKCSWIIQPKMLNFTLKLTFHQFMTECGKQYLYVFDGDSVFHPLVGSFSGTYQSFDQERNLPLEIEIKSGKAYLFYQSTSTHFSTGFNISYSVGTCLYDCFGHGNCSDGRCECDAGYTGISCSLCPNNCSSYTSSLDCTSSLNSCSCSETSCLISDTGSWSSLELNVSLVPGYASSSLASNNDEIWMYGGFLFGYYKTANQLARYERSNRQLRAVKSTNSSPKPRYGHSMVVWSNNLIVFGGKLISNEQIISEMWQYDVNEFQWSQVLYTGDFGYINLRGNNSNLRLVGHTASLIKFSNGTEIMVVLFGYHATAGLGATMYEYSPSNQNWTMPKSKGVRINGLFGHTAVLDSLSNIIYIHGSQNVDSNAIQTSVDTYSYNPATRTFYILTSSGIPRYLHSASLLHGVMYVYGGKTANDTLVENCILSEMMAYYIACDSWVPLTSPSSTSNPKRAGHRSATFTASSSNETDEIFIVSGYDSTIIENMLVYRPTSCSDFSIDFDDCSRTYAHGILCYWNGTHCERFSSSDTFQDYFCPNKTSDDVNKFCRSLNGGNCGDCMFNPYNCSFCMNPDSQMTFCDGPSNTNLNCMNDTCESLDCYLGGGCPLSASSPATGSNSRNVASLRCDQLTDCFSCARRSGCAWCTTYANCVPRSEYALLYPYSQCFEWIYTPQSCSSFSPNCSSFRTCNDCHKGDRCGWCEDQFATGLGKCMDGSLAGPILYILDMNEYNVNSGLCPGSRWNFVSCPRCQCNGHSSCNAAYQCVNCDDHATGNSCESCADGYYGDPSFGRVCKRCQCNGKAHKCHSSSGSCFCFSKGVTGPTCEACDTRQRYIGDAKGNGTCFYALEQNFVFTFNFTRTSDQNTTMINFQNTPSMEVDVKVDINSVVPVNIRLSATMQEFGGLVHLNHSYNVTSFVYTFSSDKLRFGKNQRNTTIFIFVSNFSAPNQIQISLIQRDEILLTILLFLFCGLLGALLSAGVMWKLKLTFDSYRQRVVRATQLKDMASRPYASVYLCCDDIHRSAQTFLSSGPRVAGYPGHPVAEAISDEKCRDNRASVVSVFLWLPSNVSTDRCSVQRKNSITGSDIFPPDGLSGLAIGTVLTTGRCVSVNNKKRSVSDSRTDHIPFSVPTERTLSIVHTYENEAMANARV